MVNNPENVFFNCASIRSSEISALLAGLVGYHNPNVIFECESMLNGNIPTPSFSPPDYNIYRKERYDCGGGGIFIAVRTDIPSRLIGKLSTDPEDESLWVFVRVSHNKELSYVYFTNHHQPPQHVSISLRMLCLRSSGLIQTLS